jgi:hypothetical protein
MPWQATLAIIFMWLGTLWSLIGGDIGLDKSGIWIRRSQTPILFWIVFSFWCIVLSWGTFVMITGVW